MQSKSLLIAIAAFAVTATGVHAYAGSKILSRSGLSDDQMAAIQEAQNLRSSGDKTKARDKLLSAGITEETLLSIHQATRETRLAIHEAVEVGDYEAFRRLVADLPLGDVVISEADFEQFREAHQFHLEHKYEGHQEGSSLMGGTGEKYRHHLNQELKAGYIDTFTPEQHEALMVARRANDRATIQAIFDEAGVEFQQSQRGRW